MDPKVVIFLHESQIMEGVEEKIFRKMYRFSCSSSLQTGHNNKSYWFIHGPWAGIGQTETREIWVGMITFEIGARYVFLLVN